MIALALRDAACAMEGRLGGPLGDAVVTDVAIDSRTVQPGELFFAIRGARFDGHDFVDAALARGAAACVVRADYPAATNAPLIRVDDPTAALGRLGAYHRQLCDATVIAITGSNGKTTTKNMLAHVLGGKMPGRASIKSYNNAIGVPLTLLSCAADDAFLVVEIGTNAPGEVAALAALAAPDIAVVTSIGHAHLEGLGGIEGVRREKLSIFDHVRPGGLALVEASAVSGQGVFPRAGELRWLTFGEHPEADVRVADICGDLHHTFASIDDRYMLRLHVPGGHNAVNAAAVFAVCRHLALLPDEITEALTDFTMPESRMGVRQVGAITLIDDCYNANPTSMLMAIRVLGAAREGRRVLVAGEMAELGADAEALHRAIGEEAVHAGIDVIVGVGPHARWVVDGARRLRGPVDTLIYADAADAAEHLPQHLHPSDFVLIKGSRVAGLERVAAALDRHAAEESATDAGSAWPRLRSAGVKAS